MEQLPVKPHGVRFFEGGEYRAERIASFLEAGLDQNAFVIVLATSTHLTAIEAALDALAVDREERISAGQLLLDDASAIAAMLARGNAEKSSFEELIGARVRRGIERYGKAFVYGEVVDELLRMGDAQSCLAIESFWNDLLAREPVQLLCGYMLERFASAGSSALFLEVCDAHQHIDCDPPSAAEPGRREAELLQSRAALSHEAAERRSAERDLGHAYEDLGRAYAATRTACERAEQASRAKDEFMAMLGHELRNPLSPILVAAELMARRAPDTLAAERRVIERQARHLMRLIDDLLDVARITTGRVELSRRLLELGGVVLEAIEIARPLIEQRGHALLLDVPESGLLLDGDQQRLTQVVANLLINAAKYTPEHGQIRVEAKSVDGTVKLRVSDNGVGLEPELKARIFELFVQGTQPRARSQGGLGLGLAIAYNLVTLHGGQLRAFSAGPGRGSSFEMALPLSSSKATTDSVFPLRRPSSSRPLDVLVIDDNGDLAMLFAESLREHGHRVEVALDGGAALRIAQDFQPDIALLDLGLPDIDGCELGEKLKAQLPERELKLVAISGYAQDADRQRTHAAGFDLHLVKPVPLDELEGALAALFSASRVA